MAGSTARWLLLLLISLLVCGSALCGCDSDDDDKAVLDGSGGGGTGGGDDDDSGGGDDNNCGNGVGDFDPPPGLDDFFNEDDVQDLIDRGLRVYLGDDPPDVEGTYMLDSLYIIYDDGGMTGGPLVEYRVELSGQTSSGRVDFEFETSGDTGSADSAFIYGDQGCFTVFADVHGYTPADDCNYRTPMIVSGYKGSSGILDYMFGVKMYELSGSCHYTMPVGEKRIVEETDGLAEGG